MLIAHIESLMVSFDSQTFAIVMQDLENWLNNSIAKNEDDYIMVANEPYSFRQINYCVTRLLDYVRTTHPEYVQQLEQYAIKLHAHILRASLLPVNIHSRLLTGKHILMTNTPSNSPLTCSVD